MNIAIRLLKNTIYLTIASIVAPCLSMLLVIFISRRLGAEGLGEYAAIITFTFFFETFAKLGLHHLITRDIAIDKSKGDAYLTSSILIGIGSSFLALLILYLVLEEMNYPSPISLAIKAMSFSLVFSVLINHFQSFFQGLQRMELNALITTVEALGRVVLGILVIYSGYGILGLIWAIVATRVLMCILGICLLIRLGIRPSWNIDWLVCLKLLQQTMTFLLISLVTTTYWKLDVVMLSKMKGMADVGLYNAAYRLIDILKGLSYCYIAAFFPVVASAYSVSKDSFKRTSILSVRYLFILIFPVCIGISILAGNIIGLIYGEGFSKSASALQVLIWTICFFPIALVFARALVASQNQKFDLLCNILAMVVNIILNYSLIPRFSFLGAAIATLVSICFFVSIQYISVSFTLFKISFLKACAKPFLAGCIMGMFTFLLRNTNLVFVTTSSACLYTLVLFLIRTFSSEEIMMLRELWHKKSLLVTIRG